MNTHPQESLTLAVSKYLVAIEENDEGLKDWTLKQLRAAYELAARAEADGAVMVSPSDDASEIAALRAALRSAEKDLERVQNPAFDPVLTSAALVVHAMINRRAELSESSQKSVDHHMRLFYRIASRLLDVAAELPDDSAPREVSPWGEFQGLASEIAVLRAALSAVEGA